MYRLKRVLISLLVVFLFLSATPPSHAEDALLKAQVEGILAEQKGTYSVAILDLETGDYTTINGDQTYHWASTVKLPLVLYTFIQVENGAAKLTDEIAYTENEYEDGSGHLQNKIKVGDRYQIITLIRLALRDSDNIAKLMLMHRWGRSNIEAWAATLGGRYSADGLAAQEMLVYLKYLYEHRDEPMMQRCIDELNHTPRARIGRFLPKDLVIAAKGGALPGEGHNAGIIFSERPVALAIYSKGTAETTSAYVEGLIGKAVFEQYRYRISPRIFFSGVEVVFDEGGKPFLCRGTTFVPLRRFAETAGFTVTWDQGAKTASLASQNATITFSVGSDLATVSGIPEPVVLGQNVSLIGGRTYVPIRAVSEALGFNVSWAQETTSVRVERAP